jgi:hypothetical protein
VIKSNVELNKFARIEQEKNKQLALTNLQKLKKKHKEVASTNL